MIVVVLFNCETNSEAGLCRSDILIAIKFWYDGNNS